MSVEILPLEVIAVIPARGGSKGVPQKNIRVLAGKPLIAYTIEHALASRLVTQTYVTTDDRAVQDVARERGAQIIKRPAAISGDRATSESALKHALGEIVHANGRRPDLIVFLQCTSPIRALSDIDTAIETLVRENADSLLSVAPSHRFLWKRSDTGPTPINYDYRERQRRQDLPPEFVENGSIYIFKPWVLERYDNRLGGKLAMHVMAEDSTVEIDSSQDFQIVEVLFAGS